MTNYDLLIISIILQRFDKIEKSLGKVEETDGVTEPRKDGESLGNRCSDKVEESRGNQHLDKVEESRGNRHLDKVEESRGKAKRKSRGKSMKNKSQNYIHLIRIIYFKRK